MAPLTSRACWLTPAAAFVLTAAAFVEVATGVEATHTPPTARSTPLPRRLTSRPVLVRRRILLGRSVEGRPIVAIETGAPSSRRKVLVVGCIHGNECAGTAITVRLLTLRPPTQADLWIIPNLNPDGAARGRRGNAHGVDLNRNFPWHWRPLNGTYYSGPQPLSEPESRIAHSLISQLRPAVSIWFHQHLDLVDESGGSIATERHFAALVRLPLARLTREPGSITSWENHILGGTAFVVELPAARLPPAATARFARAVMAISR